MTWEWNPTFAWHQQNGNGSRQELFPNGMGRAAFETEFSEAVSPFTEPPTPDQLTVIDELEEQVTASIDRAIGFLSVQGAGQFMQAGACAPRCPGECRFYPGPSALPTAEPVAPEIDVLGGMSTLPALQTQLAALLQEESPQEKAKKLKEFEEEYEKKKNDLLMDAIGKLVDFIFKLAVGIGVGAGAKLVFRRALGDPEAYSLLVKLIETVTDGLNGGLEGASRWFETLLKLFKRLAKIEGGWFSLLKKLLAGQSWKTLLKALGRLAKWLGAVFAIGIILAQLYFFLREFWKLYQQWQELEKLKKKIDELKKALTPTPKPMPRAMPRVTTSGYAYVPSIAPQLQTVVLPQPVVYPSVTPVTVSRPTITVVPGGLALGGAGLPGVSMT